MTTPLTFPPIKRHGMGEVPIGALVLVDAELLLELVERANPGRRLSVDWGDPLPVETWRSVYVPVFTENHDKETP